MNLSIHKTIVALAVSATLCSQSVLADMAVSGITLSETLYSGLDSSLSFTVSSDTAVEDALVFVGLTSADSESANPEFYIANLLVSLNPGETKTITQEFSVPPIANIDGEYKVSIVYDNATALAATDNAEIIDDAETPVLNHVFAGSNVNYVTPTLPSLEVSTAVIAGDNGYTLSKAEAESIALNIELMARTLDIFSPIETTFSLQMPDGATFPLTIELGDSASAASWTLAPTCKECATIEAETAIGANLSLVLSDLAKAAIANLPAGSGVSVAIAADASNNIEEWNGDKSDNHLTLPLFITE